MQYEGLGKGKKAPSSDVFQTLDKIKHLVAFNHAISGNLVRAVMNISAGNLVDLATWVLVRRDSYLPLVKYWVKPKTVLAIRISPIHLDSLFAEEHLKTAEAELQAYEARQVTRNQDSAPASYCQDQPVSKPGSTPAPARHAPSTAKHYKNKPKKPETQASGSRPSFKAFGNSKKPAQDAKQRK